MPETMSPREKVRAIIEGAINSAIPEPWEVSSHATDLILAALASSGDHAELAKRLRASKRNRHGIYGRVLVNPDGPAAAAAPEALLAENAALRADVDRLKLAICGGEDAPGAIAAVTVEDCERFCRENHASRGDLIDRATEAERKLAEAVGLLRVTLGDLDRRDVTAETANRIDHFLSKEAERG